jgi:hypothetical protein
LGLIAQIAQIELQPSRKFHRILNRTVNIAKQSSHLSRWSNMALAVLRQQSASLVQLRVIAHGSEQVKDFAVIRCRITHTVGCEHGQAQRLRYTNRSLVAPFLFPLPVTLHFDIHAVTAKDVD